MRLRTSVGRSVRVLKVRRYTEPQSVNNLTVANLHTYYVVAGAASVLVHNTCATRSIGYAPDFIDLAKKTGAKYFSVPGSRFQRENSGGAVGSEPEVP